MHYYVSVLIQGGKVMTSIPDNGDRQQQVEKYLQSIGYVDIKNKDVLADRAKIDNEAKEIIKSLESTTSESVQNTQDTANKSIESNNLRSFSRNSGYLKI